MAAQDTVKKYLAYWFQLGKRVFLHNGREAICPSSVIRGDRYSQEFEQCWQYILSPESGDCYLEATEETIDELLSSAWEIVRCARCTMPVPMPTRGMSPAACPCSDLPEWPNTEVPFPREPVSTQQRLQRIRDRLQQECQESDDGDSQLSPAEISPPSSAPTAADLPENNAVSQLIREFPLCCQHLEDDCNSAAR
ncbi:hypothetical protein [Geitlerinema sp. PCC 9228]|uniref:hypothetical protein n=1 Tax=Geitlerinema sp. PCC 9228 TaxID=111611 RepID=UPI0008F9868B|nr:hypothetical protein [Geitlerinema sp. PCC 9228]